MEEACADLVDYCVHRVATLLQGWKTGIGRRTATVTDTIERVLAEIRFDRDGLVLAVAQQHDTGEILMVAWMNCDAVRVTLTEGRACYWSRSRAALWRKGEHGPGSAAARAAPGLRRRHGIAAGRSARRRLPHRAAQLLFPRLARRRLGGDRRASDLPRGSLSAAHRLTSLQRWAGQMGLNLAPSHQH